MAEAPQGTPAGPQPQEAQEHASMHHQGDFGNYMHFKNIKLREQFASLAYDSERASSIFEGVCIHVNGYTEPSHQELKLLMARHGGRFENYFHRQHVTHIVCGNLPDTKLKQLQTERKALPIVKPSWVVACVQAGRLLPVDGYRLEATRDHPHQRRLHDFRSAPAAPLPVAELYPNLAPPPGPPPHARPPSPPPGPCPTPAAPAQAQCSQLQAAPQQQPSPATPVLQPPTARLPDATAPPIDRPAPPQEAAAAAPPAAAALAAGTPLAPATASIASAQALAADMRAACDVLKGPPRSTRDDPQGFVETFFRSSRLHFIGTWKARIDDLFAATPLGPQPAPHATGSAGERAVVHVDMDCFFAAAAAVGRPELVGVPLAVCHSSSSSGCGEVSTCNYEARAFGIRSGMFIAEAKRRCPQLVVVPYEFERYHAISQAMYRALLRVSAAVQPLSCDEALLDVTGLGDPDALVLQLRRTIQEQTGCPASAGIGPNPLVARLATAKAKPNGQHRVRPPEVQDFMRDLPVEELPGVGWSTKAKLQELGLAKACQLWAVSRELLQRHLGLKAGASLWEAARGADGRRVERPGARKSIGAEVNWGVRFDAAADVRAFLERLAAEVADRMAGARVKGRTVTLKVKRRQADAPEPAKFLGHGACDNLSRSDTLPRLTSAAGDLARCCWSLLQRMAIPVHELRGVGITVSRLESDAAAGKASLAAGKLFSLPDVKHASLWDVPQQQAAARRAGSPLQQQQEQQQQQQGLAHTPSHPAAAQEQALAHASGHLAGAVPGQPADASCSGMPEAGQPPGQGPALDAADGLHTASDMEEEEDEGGDMAAAGGVWPGSWVQLLPPAAIRVPMLESQLAGTMPIAAAGSPAGQRVAHSTGCAGASPGDAAGGGSEPPCAPAAGGPASWRVPGRPRVVEQQHHHHQQSGRPWAEQQQEPQQQRQHRNQQHVGGQLHIASLQQGSGGEPTWQDAGPAAEQQAHLDVPAEEQRHHHKRRSAQRADTAVALPPMSQVDGEVLDALPLSLLRELEHAYGVTTLQGAGRQRAAPQQQHRAPRDGAGGRAPLAKRPRLAAPEGPSAHQFPAAAAGSAAAEHDPSSSMQQATTGHAVPNGSNAGPGQATRMQAVGTAAAAATDAIDAGSTGEPLPSARMQPAATQLFVPESAAAIRQAIAQAVRQLAGHDSTGSQPHQGAVAAGGHLVAASLNGAQLGVVAELGAQWLQGLLEGQLEEAARGLRLLHRLGRQHPPFAPHARRVAAAVQRCTKRRKAAHWSEGSTVGRRRGPVHRRKPKSGWHCRARSSRRWWCGRTRRCRPLKRAGTWTWW